MAHVRAPRGAGLIRQIRNSAPARDGLASAPVEIHIERRLVLGDGVAIHLTPKECKLLIALARRAGRVVMRRRILTEVRGPAHREDTQHLRVFIGQLRAKIEVNPAAPVLIRAEQGVGYRIAEAD